jgi:hypothetical protein
MQRILIPDSLSQFKIPPAPFTKEVKATAFSHPLFSKGGYRGSLLNLALPD